MKIPSLKQLDDFRKSGFRPQVVGCIINKKKVLFLFDRRYKIWQLPQGGIDNKESIKDALVREMKEELGLEFFKDCKLPDNFLLSSDKVEFPAKTKQSRELTTNNGVQVNLQGKKYFFCLINYKGKETVDLKSTEFDDYLWASFKQAQFLATTIPQKGKKRITMTILDYLKEKGLIDNDPKAL